MKFKWRRKGAQISLGSARLGSSRSLGCCAKQAHTHRHISIALSVSVDVSLSVCKQSNQETNWVIGSLYCRSQRHPLVNVNYTIVSNHFSLLLLLILSFFCCEFFVIFSLFILSLSLSVSLAHLLVSKIALSFSIDRRNVSYRDMRTLSEIGRKQTKSGKPYESIIPLIASMH